MEIKELSQSGWVNTTGTTAIKILDEVKTYYFDFGNAPQPGVVIASPPPAAPKAGVSSPLTLGLGILGAGLLLQLLALWL